VKWQAFRNRLAALEARMQPRGVRIKLEGGLPPDFKLPAAKPPGSDLKTQSRLFGKGKGLLKTGTGGDAP
jgi:hypothetical protein